MTTKPIEFKRSDIESLPVKDKAYEITDPNFSGLKLRIEKSGTQTFIYSYRNADGKRNRITLGRYGVITPKQAKDMAKVFASDVTRGIDPQENKRQQKLEAKHSDEMIINNFVKGMYSSVILQRNKRGDYNLEVINRDFKFLLNKTLLDVTPKDIEKWIAQCLKRGLKSGTVNRRLACLKGMFSIAVELNMIDESPIRTVKNLKCRDETRIRFLSDDEKARLLETLRYRNGDLIAARLRANKWRAERGYVLYPELLDYQFADHIEPMVLLSMNTGMRRGEIFYLSWLDVDLINGLITIRARNSKSGKSRVIPMNKEVRSVLKTWQAQHGMKSPYVFPNKNGNRFKDIKKAWGKVVDDAEVEDFRFHDLRHHFASKLVVRGVPLNTIRELLGHADLSTTLRYAHLSADHKLDAVLLLDDD